MLLESIWKSVALLCMEYIYLNMHTKTIFVTKTAHVLFENMEMNS